MISVTISSPAGADRTSVTSPGLQLLLRALQFWHLASLDAPTVAMVWACAFAEAVDVPLHAAGVLALGLAAWLLYVTDRLLDALRRPPALLRERHYFHNRHRSVLLCLLLPGMWMLVWLTWKHMRPALRISDLQLSVAAALYLACVHLPLPRLRPCLARLLPKESAVAIIFALGCILPAWSRPHAAHGWLVVLGFLFSALCWLNLVAIEKWEAPLTLLHPLSAILGRHLRRACFLLLALCGVVVLTAVCTAAGGVGLLALCVACSAWLLLWLDRHRVTLAPIHLRALADAVLLTPGILLLAAVLQKL